MVICCGPESSCTRLLHRIVSEYIGVEAIHRSMPHGDEGPEGDGWWSPDEFPGARFIVITRRPDVTGLSAMAHNHVDSIGQHRNEWQRAMGILAAIPDAYWVSFEALLLWPEVQAANIARWLGVDPPREMPPVHNVNLKWLSVLEP